MKKHLSIEFPMRLIVLLDSLGTTPEEVLQNFINDLSHNADKSNGWSQRRLAGLYFSYLDFSTNIFTPSDIEKILEQFNDQRNLELQSNTK